MTKRSRAVATGRAPRRPAGVRFDNVMPLVRIFDVELAKEFYLGFWAFTLDREHHFDHQSPAYLQVSRCALTLHLTQHHGDCCPGGTIFVWMTGLDDFHREIASRGYHFMRPGIEDTFYDARCMEVTDPFGNRIRFNERNPLRAKSVRRSPR